MSEPATPPSFAELGLSEAIVVPAPANPADIAAVVGHATGADRSEHVHDGMSIGVGWPRVAE